MNKRNIKLMILAAVVATTFSTGTVLAAKPDFSAKKETKVQQKQEKVDKKQNNTNKKVSKEARIINQRLDHIENTLDKINKKMEKYFSNMEDPAETTTGSSIGGDLSEKDDDKKVGNIEKLEDTSKENTTANSSEIEGTEETTSNSASVDEGSLSNSVQDIENSSEVDADDNTDDQGLSNDFQEEYENEDNESNNSFYGKLNAVTNRLNTVKRQLNRISSVDDPQIAQLNTRTDTLIEKVQESISKLEIIQEKRVDTLKSKTKKRVMEEEKIDAEKKNWKIRFTKEIDPDTINSESITLIDSKDNVIDTDISYNSTVNEVIIEVKDGFKKGERYTILVGDTVKSNDGKKLITSVQKNFSIK